MPSSDADAMRGSLGWKRTAQMLCAWPSRVWTMDLVCVVG